MELEDLKSIWKSGETVFQPKNEQEIAITIKEDPTAKYRIQFIGKGGKLLKEEIKSPARYQIRGDEGYVRGKVLDSNGLIAWTQPVKVRDK